MAERCIANYLDKMGEYADHDFETRFVGHQVDTHMELLSAVRVYDRHAGTGLKAVLTKGQKVLEADIATLKKLTAALNKRGE